MNQRAVEALANGEEDMEQMFTDRLIELGVPPDTARQRARKSLASLAKTQRESPDRRPPWQTPAVSRPAPSDVVARPLARCDDFVTARDLSEPPAGGYSFYEVVSKWGVTPPGFGWLRETGLLSLSGPLSNLSGPERDARILSLAQQHRERNILDRWCQGEFVVYGEPVRGFCATGRMLVASGYRARLSLDQSGGARDAFGIVLLRVLFYRRPVVNAAGERRARTAAEIVEAATAILDERQRSGLRPLGIDEMLPLLSKRLPGVDRGHAREVMNSTPSLTERRPKRGRPRNAG